MDPQQERTDAEEGEGEEPLEMLFRVEVEPSHMMLRAALLVCIAQLHAQERVGGSGRGWDTQSHVCHTGTHRDGIVVK